MNRYMWNVVIVAAAAALVSSPAFAGRRTALSGNQLIKDKDDVFIYPQLMLDYRNLINFDYGSSKGAGSGMLLLGSKTFGFGILVNRSDVNPGLLGDAGEGLLRNYLDSYELGNLGAPGSVLSDSDSIGTGGYPDPKTFVDLVFAFDLGQNLLGFRVGIGTNANSEIADEETSASQFTLKLTGGMSFGKNTDLAADIIFASGQNTVGGDLQYSGQLVGINANLRGFSPMADKIDLGYMGQLGFASQTLALGQGEKSIDARNDFVLVGGAGPVYRLNKMNSTIAAYGIIGLGYSGREPNDDVDDDEQTDMRVIIPGFRMSLELNLLSWLVFRSGMEYTWSYEQDTRAAGDLTQTDQNDGIFGWNAGIGVIIEDFSFDAAFQHGWVNAGPAFLGGESDMFLVVSANYNF